jgi:hypothetical protein
MIAASTLAINSHTILGGRCIRVTAATLALLSLCLVFPALARAGEEGLWQLLAEQRSAFLLALEGPWEGQARRTPIGPRPYDLTFVRTAPQQVQGEAHPGASIHYWTFYEEETTLKLRFLSTFGDNQQPLDLTAIAEHDGALVFQAPQPGFLAVHVRPPPTALTIQIFLRGKLHVEIHLTRRS